MLKSRMIKTNQPPQNPGRFTLSPVRIGTKQVSLDRASRFHQQLSRHER
jgi:hypothetical protein